MIGRDRRWELEKVEMKTATKKEIEDNIQLAIEYLCENSYYAPLIERFPVLVDDKCPKLAREHLKNTNAPMATDANNVYINTDNLMDTLINAQEVSEKKGDYTDHTLSHNIASMLAHEYTHILSQHRRIGKELEKRNPSEIEIEAHKLACEIEANRGHMVEKPFFQTSLTYYAGVTEDDFPETKGCKYYPEIYAVLLRNAKNNMEKMKKFLEQMMKNADDLTEVGEGNKNGNKQQQKGKSSSSSGNEGKKGEKSENSSAMANQPQSGENNGKENNNSNNGHSLNLDIDGKKDSNNSKEVELTQEQIEKSIEEANKICKEIEREQAEGNPSGYGLESPNIKYTTGRTPVENLKAEYGRWHKKDIKRELKKLKGLMKGELSKKKEGTYARPTRRPIQEGDLIKKGVRYEKSYSPKILIALDSSGSMSSTTMKEVACAIENIFKDLGKPKTGSYICTHESVVENVTPMRKWKDVVKTYRPCGGNCFGHVVEEANKLGVDVVLNVGDGLDTVTRNGSIQKAMNVFKAANRKWYDVLVTDEKMNYQEEVGYDKENNFDREAIYLGAEIQKYLK